MQIHSLASNPDTFISGIEPQLTDISDFIVDEDTPATGRSRLFWLSPVIVSVLFHLCLLILLRQMIEKADSNPAVPDVQSVGSAPSIRISFRPRPLSPQDMSAESRASATEAATESTTEVIAPELAPAIIEDTVPLSQNNNVNPVPLAPVMLTPSQSELRELIGNRVRQQLNTQPYKNISCDERQHRNDLIDCGDETLETQYDFAAAEQNTTVEFFAALETLSAPVSAETSAETGADLTSTTSRTQAVRDNLTGNLAGEILRRSVMNPP